MKMKQKKKIFQYILPWVCCALMLNISELTVQANTGVVTYGSESYEWEKDTTNPIGIYVIGDEVVADYEVCLSYDDTMLRYVRGATEQDGNLLYIRGNGEEMRYKTMLYFETLRAGSTEIKVVSATAQTVLKPITVGGEEAQEEFQLDTSNVAPIYIPLPEDGGLLELVTEPVDLKDFSTDVTEYSIEVPSEIEKLEISYIPESEDATVEVSDTALKVGENTITVTVKNDDEECSYVIRVTRQEPPEPTEEPVVPTEAPPPPTERPVATEAPAVTEPVEEEMKPIGEIIQSAVLWIGCILVAALAIWYFIYILKQRLTERKILSLQKEGIKVIDMESTVINVSNVTMKFKMAKDEASSLKEYFIRALKRQNHYSYLTALDNVSFEVKQGDVVGVIGTNGSGKSTVLKIVSGALTPSKGRVDVDRSKVQMLTLGTGFDMELTAKENVYLNGSIIGYTKEYIDEKYDDIVKFAELEGFMEERMKNFSSGMVSRLGFAIATMRDTPDILILDEVLSVGDMFFRQKSEARIKEMIHSGATVLIVSHSMDTILKNCNKVVWIEKGKLQMVGDPQTVCAAYSKMEMQQ